jgi:acid phosphatase type 7
MRNRTRVTGLLLGAFATALTGAAVPVAWPAQASPDGVVLVGAGDISLCSNNGDEATAKLLDSIDGTVFTAGDNVQVSGRSTEFTNCFDPTWGRHRNRIRPVPGNHDYMTARASGYVGYYGTLGQDLLGRAVNYYSYDLGDWHVVALDSNCTETGGCGVGSPQESWLRADLSASEKKCTVAYWHHPMFTSGASHPSATTVRPLFQALYDDGAEIVMSGHNHNYERFAPQNPAGARDDDQGIRQFVIGTGGASHYGFGMIRPNSEVRNNTTFGVLKLTLNENSYDWQFVPVRGSTFTDSGTTTCH